MKRSMMISAFSFLLAVGTPALAKDFAVPGTKLTAYIPDGWKLSAAGDELLIAESPKEDEAAFLFAKVDGKSADQAVAGLDELIAKIVSDVKVTKAGKTTLNGMPAIAITGTGKADGKTALLMAVIVEAAPEKYLFTIGIVDAAKKAAYKATLDKVLGGIRKTK